MSAVHPGIQALPENIGSLLADSGSIAITSFAIRKSTGHAEHFRAQLAFGVQPVDQIRLARFSSLVTNFQGPPADLAHCRPACRPWFAS